VKGTRRRVYLVGDAAIGTIKILQFIEIFVIPCPANKLDITGLGLYTQRPGASLPLSATTLGLRN
jgi:hypothetical protein